MKESLAWSAIDLQAKVAGLAETVRHTRSVTPRQNTRTLDKLDRWESQLGYILQMMQEIELELGSTLEQTLDIKFADDELLKIAMFQLSTKNLFLEIEAHFVRNETSAVDLESLEEISMVPEMARVLALLGDAAISMAVLDYLWRPSVKEVGLLTQRRAAVVSNENLATLCDIWNLYSHRIHFDRSLLVGQTWTSSSPSRSGTGLVILHVNDVSCRIHIGMEVLITPPTVEVLPTFSLPRGTLMLHPDSSFSTLVAGLGGPRRAHCPDPTVAVAQGLTHVPYRFQHL